MTEGSSFTAFVSWPSAPLTQRLVENSLAALPHPPVISDNITDVADSPKLLQWSTYDAMDHDLTLRQTSNVLSSSYTIRKALIRKHYLSHCTQNFLVKHPESSLRDYMPHTWELELSFVDELDDMWADELWDLGAELDKGENWFILKPGMADRGMGIRLFHTKEELQRIFQEFEDREGEIYGEEVERSGTAVATSQLRHFVVQEYLSSPLLLDPAEVPLTPELQLDKSSDGLQGHKFHLRAYCVASGALSVYLYTRVLALFSSMPYTPPSDDPHTPAEMDLSCHLTNTSLQIHRGEAGVRLLDELLGCKILSGTPTSDESDVLTEEDFEDIKLQMGEALGETFKAALEMSVHFQPLPNAFELFGVDFMVTHVDHPNNLPRRRFQVKLLEVNAEPAIELTGPRLTWILQSLFTAIGAICVAPFFQKQKPESEKSEVNKWEVGEVREHLYKCLDVNVRGAGGW